MAEPWQKGAVMIDNGTDDFHRYLTSDDDTAPREPVATMPIRLSPAIVAMKGNDPVVLVRSPASGSAGGVMSLPFGPIESLGKGPIEAAVRYWASQNLGLALGHVEQLSVFSDEQAAARETRRGARRALSIGLLALTRSADEPRSPEFAWAPWYAFLPWEDWRQGRPGILDRTVLPAVEAHARSVGPEADAGGLDLAERISVAFATNGQRWNEDMVLERFEILAEAGLVENGEGGAGAPLGEPMACGQRRVLAAAIGRLRAHMRERPIAFDLMGEQFTLLDLQRTVEAMLGPHLHKQNFRRLVEAAKLVEPTGEINTQTGGRPAKMFRFRRQALLESSALGLRARSRG